MPQNKFVKYSHLGLIEYQTAWDLQEKLLAEIVALKVENRALDVSLQKPTPNYLLFCEHPHVYTLGKSGHESHLLINDDF